MQQSNQQRSPKCSGHRAESADDNHDERFDQNAQIHLEIDGFAWDLQRSGETRQKCAKREHRRKEHRLVQAKRTCGLAILRSGSHPYSPARPIDHPPQQCVDGRPDDHDEDRILRNERAGNLDAPL